MKNVKFIGSSVENYLPGKSREKIRSLYRSSDLYLAGFLKAKGLYLEGIEKDGDKITFVFRGDSKRIQESVNGFYNDSSVGVLSFKAALHDLRSIIFNQRRSTFSRENNVG